MPSVLIFIFQKARARIVKWPEATTRWHLRTSVLMLLATLFFTAAPSLYNTHESHWKEYEAKYRAPLTPIVHSTEGGDEHTAKLDLRLTVPLLANVLGFGKHGTYLLLALCALLVCWIAPAMFLSATGGQRSLAFWLSLTVSGGHLFSLFFRPLTGYFDGVALTLVLCCFAVRQPLIQFFFAVLALFADERAVFGLALAPVFQAVTSSPSAKVGFSRLVWASWPYASAGLVWLGLRLLATREFGLQAPLGGVGLGIAAGNYNLFPAAIWEVFQAGWGLVLGGLLLLFRRAPLATVGALLVLLAGLAGSALVLDLTRSATYIFPMIFIAALGFRGQEYRPWLLPAFMTCSLLALLEPNLDIIGPAKDAIFIWSKPIWITLPLDFWYFVIKGL
jgi:hypothetical protein